jgi:hypothetical protein
MSNNKRGRKQKIIIWGAKKNKKENRQKKS